MTSTTPFSFEGYDDLISKPLERIDPRSFALIRKLLENVPLPAGSSPFGFLIKTLASVAVSSVEARNHWKKIVEHKRQLELKLRRAVNIKTACIDYYDQLGVDPAPAADGRKPAATLTQVNQPSSGALPAQNDLYLERLKEEMMRARRYKHALSVILFDVDLREAAPGIADKAIPIIMKLINKAVRTVDIFGQHSNNLFLLILPNTNKREALELAERLKNNIRQRITRIPGLSGDGIPITIAAGQCSKEDTATDFIKRLERLGETGRQKKTAAIYTLD